MENVICLELDCFGNTAYKCRALESAYKSGKCPFKKSKAQVEREMRKCFAKNIHLILGGTETDEKNPYRRAYRKQADALKSECEARGVGVRTVLEEWKNDNINA